MSKTLVIGSCTFLYPVAGTKPGWAEEAADWAEAVTNKLATVSGTNDICTKTVTVLACQCAANIGSGQTALSFSTATVRSFVVTYNVLRGSTVETGSMEGAQVGGTWVFSHDHTGCTGMCFDITSAGQVQYYSDCSCAGTITFNATTLAI